MKTLKNQNVFAKKIFIIGNIASGKTKLARQLSKKLEIPILHVDAIQFDSELNVRPRQQTVSRIQEFKLQDKWIVDGFGPFELIPANLKDCDLVIFLDCSIWQNYLWLAKRWGSLLFEKRPELVGKSSELKLRHMFKAVRSLRQFHLKMRPELIRVLNQETVRAKVLRVRNVREVACDYET